MAKLVYFCTLLYFACFATVFSQHSPKYDLAERFGQFANHLHSSKQLRSLSNETDILSSLNKYNSFITPNGTIDPGIIEYLRGLEQLKCVQDLIYVFKSFPGTDMWSVKMLDSYAKPDSGILIGNTKWLGNYHECVNVYAPPKNNSSVGNFHGQYCTAQASFKLKGMTLPFTLGICLPDSCDMSNYTHGITNVMNIQNAPVPDVIAESPVNISLQSCQPRTKEFTNAAIGMIVLLSILVFLAAVGSFITIFEYFVEVKNEPPYMNMESGSINDLSDKNRRGSISEEVLIRGQQTSPAWLVSVKSFFNCFCVFTNGAKLLNTSNTEGQLLCVNGIRFLSMSWVMVCHTYTFVIGNINNIGELPDLLDNVSFQIILNGFFSVDSFFFLSGFLLAYLFFKEAEKNDGKVPWVYFYVHRYIRLTPVYMIVLGTYTALFYYMGSGPLWSLNKIDPLCHDSWWYNILYINNFQSMSKQCIAWSWYLANDMQFFVISPLFLITLRKWPKVGISLLGLFLSGHFAANFGITYHYNLLSGFGDLRDLTGMQDLMTRWQVFMDKLYVRPYTRIGPYLVGIALGYYLNFREKSNAGKDSKPLQIVGWLLSTAVVLACQFGLYHRKMSLVERAFYNATNRICFGLGLGWVVYACLTKQGGPVNKLLSYKLFIPLSRLTYCAYLIHPVVMYWYFLSLKTTLTFSHVTMVFLFFGFLIATYSFAFLTSLLFESPIIRLEKMIRTSFSKKPSS